MGSKLWRLKSLTAASVAALLAACATPPPTPEEMEARAWRAATSQDNPFAYDEYLRLYGDWPNAAGARVRIDSLMRDERAAWVRTQTRKRPMRITSRFIRGARMRRAPMPAAPNWRRRGWRAKKRRIGSSLAVRTA